LRKVVTLRVLVASFLSVATIVSSEFAFAPN